MQRSVYAGLAWAYTPYGKEILLELVATGLEYDLAVSLLHNQVEAGAYSESDIYEAPDDESEVIVLGEI